MNHPTIDAMLAEKRELLEQLEQARRIVDHLLTEPTLCGICRAGIEGA